MKTEKLAHWAEIISSLVVVLSLIFLIHEVQRNTRAVERQAAVDRAAAFNAPFFESSELASVLAKIKAVDGIEAVPSALSERYGLDLDEAILWDRHLWQVWTGLEADYYQAGASPDLRGLISDLLQFPDQQIWWTNMGPGSRGEFRAFVDSIAAVVGPAP